MNVRIGRPDGHTGATLDVKIVLIRFKKDGSRGDLRVKADPATIGRGDDCDIRVPSSKVSREHCRIWTDDGKVFIKDLGSSNGTFVNAEKIDDDTELSPGDQIAIGAFVLTVQIDGDPAYVEPPLLEAPAAAPTESSGDADESDLSGSDADISDLIAQISSEDSSAFEFDLDDSDI